MRLTLWLAVLVLYFKNVCSTTFSTQDCYVSAPGVLDLCECGQEVDGDGQEVVINYYQSQSLVRVMVSNTCDMDNAATQRYYACSNEKSCAKDKLNQVNTTLTCTAECTPSSGCLNTQAVTTPTSCKIANELFAVIEASKIQLKFQPLVSSNDWSLEVTKDAGSPTIQAQSDSLIKGESKVVDITRESSVNVYKIRVIGKNRMSVDMDPSDYLDVDLVNHVSIPEINSNALYNQGSEFIQITWDSVDGASGYKVISETGQTVDLTGTIFLPQSHAINEVYQMSVAVIYNNQVQSEYKVFQFSRGPFCVIGSCTSPECSDAVVAANSSNVCFATDYPQGNIGFDLFQPTIFLEVATRCPVSCNYLRAQFYSTHDDTAICATGFSLSYCCNDKDKCLPLEAQTFTDIPLHYSCLNHLSLTNCFPMQVTSFEASGSNTIKLYFQTPVKMDVTEVKLQVFKNDQHVFDGTCTGTFNRNTISWCNIEGLLADTEYQVKVQGKNEHMSSGISDSFTVKTGNSFVIQCSATDELSLQIGFGDIPFLPTITYATVTSTSSEGTTSNDLIKQQSDWSDPTFITDQIVYRGLPVQFYSSTSTTTNSGFAIKYSFSSEFYSHGNFISSQADSIDLDGKCIDRISGTFAAEALTNFQVRYRNINDNTETTSSCFGLSSSNCNGFTETAPDGSCLIGFISTQVEVSSQQTITTIKAIWFKLSEDQLFSANDACSTSRTMTDNNLYSSYQSLTTNVDNCGITKVVNSPRAAYSLFLLYKITGSVQSKETQSVITYDPGFEIRITCEGTQTIHAAYATIEEDSSVTKTMYSKLEFKVTFYSDPFFKYALGDSPEYTFGSEIYVKVSVENEITNVKMLARKAFCTPTSDYNDDNFYILMKDTCPHDSTFKRLNSIAGQSNKEEYFTFSPFKLVSEGSSVVYIHFDAYVCSDSDADLCTPSTDCSGYRKKRDVSMKKHIIVSKFILTPDSKFQDRRISQLVYGLFLLVIPFSIYMFPRILKHIKSRKKILLYF